VRSPVEPIPEPSPDLPARQLEDVRSLASTLAEMAAGYAGALSQVPNQLLPVRGADADAAMGTPDDAYAVGYWTLEPGTALVVEGTPPEARYRNLYLGNRRSESFRTETHHDTCVNSSRMRYEPDGRFRIAIAPRRPAGAADWLNTRGRTGGWTAPRWLCASGDVPLPTCHLVPMEELERPPRR
jgi:hypothetical protein